MGTALFIGSVGDETINPLGRRGRDSNVCTSAVGGEATIRTAEKEQYGCHYTVPGSILRSARGEEVAQGTRKFSEKSTTVGKI